MTTRHTPTPAQLAEIVSLQTQLEIEHALLTGYGYSLPPLIEYFRSDSRVIALRKKFASEALRTLADTATLERYEDNEVRAMVAERARAALAKVD